MIASTSQTKPTPSTPHRFPLGYTRVFSGVRCMLYAYTRGSNPLPKYRRPDGSTFTHRPGRKKRRERPRGPDLWAKVKVCIPAKSIEGVVIKRSPLLIRVTDKGSELYGKVLERPRYVLRKKKKQD